MRRVLHSYGDLTGGQWLRGNLHAHTTRSDGALDPQTVLDEYARRGYDFLSLSDHDVFTSAGEYAAWDVHGMVMIPGNEISRYGPHLLHVDGDRFIQPKANRQSLLNDVNAAGRGWAVVNHPNYGGTFEHCTNAQLREWTGYVGMEIYNGVIGRVPGSQYSLDKWDMILTAGARPCWGFANDDTHVLDDIERGWNVAYARERSAAGVAEALRSGRFYCSTGVAIRAIRVDGLTIRVDTENAERIVAIQDLGERFAVVDESAIEVTVPPHATYVRFECWGRGERMAWTQPFFIEHDRADASASDFIEHWQVSPLHGGVALAQTSPQHARLLPPHPMRINPADDIYLPNFLDLRVPIDRRSGVLYLSAELPSDTARRAILRLGYDGPIRVWLNDQPLFDGPGTNPAKPDQLSLYASLQTGMNRLLVALDSNGGKAWGLFARCENIEPLEKRT